MKLKNLNWSKYEVIWLFSFSFTAIFITILNRDTALGFSVFLSGVLCVVLAAKGNIWTYIFGMYNTIGYAYLAFTNHLYGEMGLNIFFFIPMNLVGYIKWKSNKTESGSIRMKRMKISKLYIVLFVCLSAILAMGFGLSFIEGQRTPYIDATTNVLSIAATLLMVSCFREQWILYIILNIFTILMWTIRLIDGSSDGIIMIIMWSAYLINSVYGFYVWSKGAEKEVYYEKNRIVSR